MAGKGGGAVLIDDHLSKLNQENTLGPLHKFECLHVCFWGVYVCMRVCARARVCVVIWLRLLGGKSLKFLVKSNVKKISLNAPQTSYANSDKIKKLFRKKKKISFATFKLEHFFLISLLYKI